MKSRNVLLIYLFALVGGIILMIMHNRAQLFEGIAVAAGILFIVSCSYILLTWIISYSRRCSKAVSHAEELDRRTMRSQQGLMLISVAGGIAFGILMVCNPAFFVNYLIYTFGVVMILCGLSQLAFTIPGMRLLAVNRWWLLPPLLVITSGVTVFILGPDAVKDIITMLTGIVLTAFGIEGFIGYIYRQSRLRATEMMIKDDSLKGDLN